MRIQKGEYKSFKDKGVKRKVTAIAMAVALTVPWALGINAIVQDRKELQRRNDEIFNNAPQISTEYEEVKLYDFEIEVLSTNQNGETISHTLGNSDSLAIYDEENDRVVILAGMGESIFNAVNAKTGEHENLTDYRGCPLVNVFDIVENGAVAATRGEDGRYVVTAEDLENAARLEYLEKNGMSKSSSL